MPPDLFISVQSVWRVTYAPMSIDLVFTTEAATIVYRDALLAVLAAEAALVGAQAQIPIANAALAAAALAAI
jgi:hypothetical protein